MSDFGDLLRAGLDRKEEEVRAAGQLQSDKAMPNAHVSPQSSSSAAAKAP